jgi:hypothetical protein
MVESGKSVTGYGVWPRESACGDSRSKGRKTFTNAECNVHSVEGQGRDGSGGQKKMAAGAIYGIVSKQRIPRSYLKNNLVPKGSLRDKVAKPQGKCKKCCSWRSLRPPALEDTGRRAGFCERNTLTNDIFEMGSTQTRKPPQDCRWLGKTAATRSADVHHNMCRPGENR